MSEVKQEQVLNILKSITHPNKGDNIVALGMVQGLVIKDGEVGFALNINPAEADLMEQVRKSCDAKLLEIDGIDRVVSVLTAEMDRTNPPPLAKPPAASPMQGAKKIAGVRHVVAVASGKGGVGKSTTAVNLACALTSDIDRKFMSEVKQEQVLNILKSITHPNKGDNIVALGMVQGLVIKDGEVGFALNINPAEADLMEQVRKSCDAKLLEIDGIDRVVSVLTAEMDRTNPPPLAKPPAASPMQGAKKIAGVRHVVAVASGKGGVGKSTTAVNLACALQSLGLRAGIFDVDIYGPSIPLLLGVTERPTQSEDKKIVPILKYDLVSMSLGYLMAQDTATIWRGPMVMGAVKQMTNDTKWDINGEIDVLILDLPPGTGDVQLTLAQTIKMDGAVVVSTPQDIALIDARKGLDMFAKTNTKVLGIIENMSYFSCPSCGERSDIFGHGGARETAEKMGVDFLGEIPLHMDIRETADNGTPIVLLKPDSPHSQIYIEIARKIQAKLK